MMGKHTRHGVPIDYVPSRARHRAEVAIGAPVYVDGRDIVATVARLDSTYSAARLALERATLEAEYRGLGIDPALIDIIESDARRAADERPVARSAADLRAIGPDGMFTHRGAE